MTPNECIDHPGLISAIGSCSDEATAILNKVFSYLGISYVSNRSAEHATDRCAFVLSIRDEATDLVTEEIEFDDATESWHRIQRNETRQDRTNSESPTCVAQQLSSKDEKISDSSFPPPLTKPDEDWTTLLPSTDHVRFMKSREWHKTSLGPMLEWPASLRLMTMKMLADPRPANLYWGPDRVAIYNEPFSVVAASRHPAMMGATAEDAMPATYPFLSKTFHEVEATGIAFSMPRFEMEVEKVAGFVEEAWYDGVFSPIRDIDGQFLGLYNSGYEITAHTMAQRNSEAIHQIVAGPTSSAISPWQHIVQACSPFDRDIPFLVLYSVEARNPTPSSRLVLKYQGSLGIELGHPALPESLDIYQGNDGFMPVLRTAKARESFASLDMPGGKLPEFLTDGVDWRGHGDPCTHIVASPLYVTGLLSGFFIIGVNPRRPYDDAHKRFVEDIVRASNGLLAYDIGVNQAHQREEQLINELTQRQKFLQSIAEAATVGLCFVDSDALLTWANPIFFDITGVTRKSEERYNSQSDNYVHDDDQDEGKEAFLRCIQSKSVCTVELRLKKTWRPPQSEREENRWVIITLSPTLEDEKATGVIACVTDISHLKWAQKIQTDMAEAAQLAKQQQERFIDFTSHEMRNPLGAVLQCADDIVALVRDQEVMARGCGVNNCANTFQTILENANNILFCVNHQNRIIGDVLTISKLDSSMLKITPVIMNPHKVIVEIMQAYTNELAARSILSRLEVGKGYAELQMASTCGDPGRLTQILINLISNAIKFTKNAPRKELCIRMDALSRRPLPDNFSKRVQWFPSNPHLSKHGRSHEAEAAENVLYIMFEVEDSGSGMSKEEMKGLFNRFTQASPKTHITYGGSGLGLFISRELVELQGGMIGVSSQPDIGSVFAFYIETRKAGPTTDTVSQTSETAGCESTDISSNGTVQASASDDGSSLKNLASRPRSVLSQPKPSKTWSILFVEDNIINQKVLSKQLKRLGFAVHVANHGVEALDFIKQSIHWKGNQADGVHFDVVLMDWEMPVMDGVTCTKEIRRMEATGSITTRLLVVGATANARPEQIETALCAGMDDVVTKPFTVTALVERIERLLVR